MAPGSSAMLRARRRDVNVKPNRVLDRNSSRGMIYENEELRLRTININAEVERGQNDIKKLRRENETLRREIWALREEYDRLEAILKRKEQASEDAEESEDEDSDDENDDDKDEADQENATNQQKVAKDIDMLSVVEEEPEENSTEGDEKQQPTQPQQNERQQSSMLPIFGEPDLPPALIPIPFIHSTNIADNSFNSGEAIPTKNSIPGFQPNVPGYDIPLTNPFLQNQIPTFSPQDLNQVVQNYCPGQPITGISSMASKPEDDIQQVPLPPPPPPPPPPPIFLNPLTTPSTSNLLNQQTINPPNISLSSDLRCEPYAGKLPAFLRLNCVQPHTLYFPVTNPIFNDLTVQEVIDSLSDQLPIELLNSLKGVRLVGGACYLSLSSDDDSKSLMTKALKIRDESLQLEDASLGAMYLALSGVPHDVSDETVANTLAHYGTVIGGVERRLYRGVDTGERLTRLRPRLAIPRVLWLGGCKVCLRVMRPEEVSALALARRKSFRSHLHVRLRPLSEDVQPPPPIPPLPVTTTTTSVTQSVPNLGPQTTEAPPPPIGFSCTQSVPDLTIRLPPPDPPPKPKPQFFSSSSASNVFLFPAPCQDPTKRHSNVNTPAQIHSTTPQPQIPNATAGRSQSTPPVIQPQSSPNTLQRQTSHSDPETPKPPSPSPSKLQRHRSSRKGSKQNSPNETRKANGDASSSSGQDSPSKPGRRRMSVYFKRNGSIRRTGSVEQTDGTAGELTTTCSERERSNSDVSSRTSGGCRRKLSSTGRENGKVPWCGCWGNGCI